MNQTASHIRVAVVGEVDHGKSSIIGRLRAEIGDASSQQLEDLPSDEEGNRNYAHLVDSFALERNQGITLDTARIFLRTAERTIVLVDTPGHRELLPNLVTGASRADSAVLVVDVTADFLPAVRRNGHLLRFLAIDSVLVAVNKLDLVGYEQQSYVETAMECRRVLAELGYRDISTIPVSAVSGDNVYRKGNHMPWNTGPTLLERLLTISSTPTAADLPFRFWVQSILTDVPGLSNLLVGNVASGTVCNGDVVAILPEGVSAKVIRVVKYGELNRGRAMAGESVGLLLDTDAPARRGLMLATPGTAESGRRLRASLCDLAPTPLSRHTDYIMRIGTAETRCRIVQQGSSPISHGEDIAPSPMARGEVRNVCLVLEQEVAFDSSSALRGTPAARFVLIAEDRIVAVGVIESNSHSSEG